MSESDALLKFSFIRKLPDGKYRVLSETGRNLGTYDSRAEAVARLKQVEMFKHMKKRKKTASASDIDLTNVHDYSYSAIIRELRKQDASVCTSFMKIFNNIFEEQIQAHEFSDELVEKILDESLKELSRVNDIKVKTIKKLAKVTRFAEVEPGLYRGSAPSPTDLVFLKKKYDIKKIISLDLEAAEKINRACKLMGIKQIILPISYDNFRHVDKFAKMDLRKLLLEGGPTFVHCLHGKDRTGFLVALFRAQQGVPFDKAMKEALSFDFGSGLKPEMKNKFVNVIHKACKSNTDENEVNDIVMNQDLYDSIVNPVELPSFSPYTYNTAPQSQISDNLYPTRQDIETGPISNFPYESFLAKEDDKEGDEKVKEAPQVGEIDSYTMLNGYGPVGGLGS